MLSLPPLWIGGTSAPISSPQSLVIVVDAVGVAAVVVVVAVFVAVAGAGCVAVAVVFPCSLVVVAAFRGDCHVVVDDSHELVYVNSGDY